ncbi:hypothetical protein Tco_0583044 [Tanacetum coccineum]
MPSHMWHVPQVAQVPYNDHVNVEFSSLLLLVSYWRPNTYHYCLCSLIWSCGFESMEKPVSFASMFKDNTSKKTVQLSELRNDECVSGADV